MNLNTLCLFVLLSVVVFFISFNFIDFFNTEKYTPSIVRPLPCTKDQNNCPFPCTNNTLDTTANNDVYVYQYGNRRIKNPEQYLQMVRQLLNDMTIAGSNGSNESSKVFKINDDLLKEIDFTGDRRQITKSLDKEINKLVKTKKYLQNNGTWKYEYFSTSDPNIYFYEVDNKNKLFSNYSNKFKLLKVIYTLANPLRSSYTSCLAFISVNENKLNLE